VKYVSELLTRPPCSAMRVRLTCPNDGIGIRVSDTFHFRGCRSHTAVRGTSHGVSSLRHKAIAEGRCAMSLVSKVCRVKETKDYRRKTYTSQRIRRCGSVVGRRCEQPKGMGRLQPTDYQFFPRQNPKTPILIPSTEPSSASKSKTQGCRNAGKDLCVVAASCSQ
jgi:hypothetical protein